MVPTALLALFSLAAAQAKDLIQTHFTPPRELDAPVWTTPTGPFLQGTIRLSGERSGELGWVFNELDESRVFSFRATHRSQQALRVTFPTSSCESLPQVFPIWAPTLSSASTPYFGLSTIEAGGADVTKWSGSAVYPVGTSESEVGSTSAGPTSFSNGVNYPALSGGQSAIWSMDCSDNSLTATWINNRGRAVPLTSSYLYRSMIFAYSHRPGTPTKGAGEKLTLTFVPDKQSPDVEELTA